MRAREAAEIAAVLEEEIEAEMRAEMRAEIGSGVEVQAEMHAEIGAEIGPSGAGLLVLLDEVYVGLEPRGARTSLWQLASPRLRRRLCLVRSSCVRTHAVPRVTSSIAETTMATSSAASSTSRAACPRRTAKAASGAASGPGARSGCNCARVYRKRK